jgi:hypothetical protein
MTMPNTPTTSPIADFSDSDLQLLGQILFERYARLVPIQSADAELQLDPQQETLTLCPSLYWEERGANFVVIKIGDNRFRCQFFYSDQEQFGTGREFYDNLGDCVVTMLQVQADHERAQKGVLSGMTAKELPKAVDDDYFGPLII